MAQRRRDQSGSQSAAPIPRRPRPESLSERRDLPEHDQGEPVPRRPLYRLVTDPRSAAFDGESGIRKVTSYNGTGSDDSALGNDDYAAADAPVITVRVLDVRFIDEARTIA